MLPHLIVRDLGALAMTCREFSHLVRAYPYQYARRRLILNRVTGTAPAPSDLTHALATVTVVGEVVRMLRGYDVGSMLENVARAVLYARAHGRPTQILLGVFWAHEVPVGTYALSTQSVLCVANWYRAWEITRFLVTRHAFRDTLVVSSQRCWPEMPRNCRVVTLSGLATLVRPAALVCRPLPARLLEFCYSADYTPAHWSTQVMFDLDLHHPAGASPPVFTKFIALTQPHMRLAIIYVGLEPPPPVFAQFVRNVPFVVRVVPTVYGFQPNRVVCSSAPSLPLEVCASLGATKEQEHPLLVSSPRAARLSYHATLVDACRAATPATLVANKGSNVAALTFLARDIPGITVISAQLLGFHRSARVVVDLPFGLQQTTEIVWATSAAVEELHLVRGST